MSSPSVLFVVAALLPGVLLAAPSEDPLKLASDASEEEIALGRALFSGAERLESGGAPCIGCHDARGAAIAGGGSLASDLTFVYARMGEQQLVPALSEMSTPVMASLYGSAPLNGREQYALKAFFWNESRDGSKHRPDRDFFWLGLAGLAAALGLVGVVWGTRS